MRNIRGAGAGGQWGWVDFLAAHLDTTKVNIVNRAVGGTSARSFIPAGHWETALALVNSGDVVMIQFGHNDSGARGAVKGIGLEIEELENPTTKQKETVLTFGAYLRRYIADIRAKGATPVVCSLIPRKIWKDVAFVDLQPFRPRNPSPTAVGDVRCASPWGYEPET